MSWGAAAPHSRAKYFLGGNQAIFWAAAKKSKITFLKL